MGRGRLPTFNCESYVERERALTTDFASSRPSYLLTVRIPSDECVSRARRYAVRGARYVNNRSISVRGVLLTLIALPLLLSLSFGRSELAKFD